MPAKRARYNRLVGDAPRFQVPLGNVLVREAVLLHTNEAMRTKVTLDKKGRVLIPKPLRDKLYVGPGDSLRLDGNEKQIVLRPVRNEVERKDGLWVLRTGKPLTLADTNAVLQAIRDERDAQNLGQM